MKASLPVKEFFLMTLGTSIGAMGSHLFKFPNNFSTGGVTGLSVILSRLFPAFSSADYAAVINLFFLVLGFLLLGRGFGIRTVYCSLLFSGLLKGLELLFPLSSPLTNAPMLELEGGGTDRRQFTESRDLFKWGFSNFTRRQIVDTATPLAQVEVTLSQTDHVLVRPAHQLERTLPRDLKLEDIKQ